MSDVFNRVIPCLLLHDGGLVKTRCFGEPRYVGDPINAVRIFNEKYVDELVLLDIAASRAGAEPDYDLIARISGECFMPLCYGGGIRRLEQARRLVTSGVEKIAVNSMAIDRPALLRELCDEFGASSVVAGIDVVRDRRGRACVYHPGQRRATALSPLEQARAVVKAGAGEIFLNSVDRDGMRCGFDLDLIQAGDAGRAGARDRVRRRRRPERHARRHRRRCVSSGSRKHVRVLRPAPGGIDQLPRVRCSAPSLCRMNAAAQECTRCVMDAHAADIRFDAKGRCNYCTAMIDKFGTSNRPTHARSRTGWLASSSACAPTVATSDTTASSA